MPPFVDSCHLPFGSGNGCTTISYRPDSFVLYATQRPSGENCPVRSSNIVFATMRGFGLLPVIGRAQRRVPIFGSFSVYSRNRPSLDQSWGTFIFGVTSSSSSAPAPLESLMYRSLRPPFRLDEKTI